MKHYIYAAGAILCWASLPAATGSGLADLSIEELMFFSFTCATLFLYVKDVILTRSFALFLPNLRISLLGVWGIFLYHYLYFIALNNAPLAEGTILATTWSFWIVVFSSVIFLKRLNLSVICTALAGMVGAGLVIASGKDMSFNIKYLNGYLLALFCGLIWSSFSVALGKTTLRKEPMTAFTLFAALLSALLYMATFPHTIPPLKSVYAAIYLGCIPLGLSFFLWNRAVTGGNLVIIGFLSYFTPPLAVLLVALVHGEVIRPQVIVGMAVIIAAAIGGRIGLSRSSPAIKPAGNTTITSSAPIQ